MSATTCHPMPWAHLFMSRRSRRHHHGGPPSWVVEMMGHRGPRAERGDVRYLVLDTLREEKRHGYEIIQVIADRTGGAYKPSPGTIYPTLQMLEELGHVHSEETSGRRLYEITDEGRAELDAHQEEIEEAWDRLTGDDEWFDAREFHELFRDFGRLMRGLGRGFRRGRLGPDTLRQIRAILADALERVEAVLHGDDRE